MDSGHEHLQSITSAHLNLEKGFLYWKQRMKNQWTLLGDCPSHILYTKIRKRKSRNDIVSLKDVQGNWTTEPQNIMNIVQDFWMSIFSNDSSSVSEDETDQVLREPDLPTLTTQQQVVLSQHFSAKEIKNVMFSIADSKSPGPKWVYG